MPTGGTPIQFATFVEFRGIFQETANIVLQLGASDVLGWDTKRITAHTRYVAMGVPNVTIKPPNLPTTVRLPPNTVDQVRGLELLV